MMLPGTTISPPNFLTPSRRPALSRPLRDEPPAFLCAICCSLLGLQPRRAARASDVSDAQNGLLLPMPLLAAVIVQPLLLEDDDLSRPRLLDNGGADRRAVEKRCAGRDLGPFADHQHLAQLDHGAGFGRHAFDRDDVVLGNLVLFAAGADDCEHDTRQKTCRRPNATGNGARLRPDRANPVREPRSIGPQLGLSTISQRDFDGTWGG